MNKSQYHRKKYLQRRKAESIGFPAGVCTVCGGNAVFYEKYDVLCCLQCNVWLSEKCSDPCCPYCSQRPDTPAEALIYEEHRCPYGKDWRRDNYFHKHRKEKFTKNAM